MANYLPENSYLPGNELLPDQQLNDQLQSINREVGNIERSSKIPEVVMGYNVQQRNYELLKYLNVFVGPNGKLPTRGSEFSAGWDLYSSEDIMLCHGTRKLIDTDIIVSIPKGWYGRIAPRSGLALKNGISVVNTPGTIDSGYRGEIGVVLINHDLTESFSVKVGDRIAQLVIQKFETGVFETVSELPTSERASGGYGSTGK